MSLWLPLTPTRQHHTPSTSTRLSGGKLQCVPFEFPHSHLHRFCQIRFFFERKSKTGNVEKMFHGLWFSHGSKTLLQETSHSKALYLLGTCDDNLITTIVKKCNFKIMRPDEEEVEDDGDAKSNDFHCGYVT